MGIMSNVQDQIDNDDYVLLKPFSHQIGGHNIVLQYDNTTICKLLNLREKFFYETIPKDLYEYLPEYKGTIEVQIKDDDEGKKFLTYCNNNSNTPPPHHHHHVKTDCGHKQWKNETSQRNSIDDDDINLVNNKKPLSQLQRKFINKMNDTVLNFILLENIVAKYSYPCILDIKMGTQQHGDDASEQKKRLQTIKCQNSTSGKIGSRLCGMQVYQKNKNNYIFYDKYAGRSLSVDGYKQNLLQFLHNGLKFRSDVIDPLIEKLERLYQIIKSKSAYRFYGSSLLVLYDGGLESTNSHPKIDVRMIDFAHSTHIGYKQDSKIHNGPDEGYLFGLDNLIKIFKEIKSDCIELSRADACVSNTFEAENEVLLANNINISHICVNQKILPPPEPSPSPSSVKINYPITASSSSSSSDTQNVFFQ